MREIALGTVPWEGSSIQTLSVSSMLVLWLASAGAPPLQELEDACTAGRAADCATLGAIYREGAGVSLDECHAAKLFDRACTLGSGEGCTGLGAMYEDGSCREHSRSRAKALYEKACAAGSGMGCKNLGDLYLAGGDGDPPNPDRGYDFLQQACRMGVASACDEFPPDLQLGMRGELDVLGGDTWMAVTGEFERGNLALVAMVLLRYPPALRLEGRVYPLRWGNLQTYAGVGVTYWQGLAGRGAAGIDLQLGHLHLSADVSWEHRFTSPLLPSNTRPPDDLLPVSVGLGWTF